MITANYNSYAGICLLSLSLSGFAAKESNKPHNSTVTVMTKDGYILWNNGRRASTVHLDIHVYWVPFASHVVRRHR